MNMTRTIVFFSCIVALAFSFSEVKNYELLCDRCKCPGSDLENTVNCSNRRITDLFNDIKFPSYVTIVKFRNSQIKELNKTVFTGGLKVETLDLSHNQIDFLADDVFANLENLKEVDLSHNRIWKLALGTFRGPPYLKAINLAYNNIQSVYSELFKCENLEEIDLSYNPLKNLHENCFSFLKALKILDLSSTQISTLPEKIFANNPQLHLLDLSENSFLFVPTKGITSATELVHLIISENPIGYIEPKAFVGLSNLEVLTITHMRNLSSLERHSLSGLTRLKKLFISDNLILSKISGLAFKKEAPSEDSDNGDSNEEETEIMPSLELLSLRHNNLSWLPEDLLDWSHLKQLDLTENPWSCDCHLSWMAGVSFPHNVKGKTKCKSPSRLAGRAFSKLVEKDYTCSYLTSEAAVAMSVIVIAAFLVVLAGVGFVLYRRSLLSCRSCSRGRTTDPEYSRVEFTNEKRDLEWDSSADADPETKA